jgi:hypothetical protein
MFICVAYNTHGGQQKLCVLQHFQCNNWYKQIRFIKKQLHVIEITENPLRC